MLGLLFALLIHIQHIDMPGKLLFSPVNSLAREVSALMHRQTINAHNAYQSLPPLRDSVWVRPRRIVTAEAGIVTDSMSGEVLWSKQPDAVLPIASLTKLVTAMVFLETNTNFDTEIVIEGVDNSNVPGSRFYVQPGEIVLVRDLFFSSLVGSANNATKALARSTGLAEQAFIQRMNEMVDKMGLANTVFYDVTGLNPDNVSTVYEYSVIARRAFQYEKINEALQVPVYEFSTVDQKRHYRITNTNSLLADTELDIIGGKTGYLHEAGFTYACQTAGQQSTVVVLFHSIGSDARFAEAKALVTWAQQAYFWPI